MNARIWMSTPPEAGIPNHMLRVVCALLWRLVVCALRRLSVRCALRGVFVVVVVGLLTNARNIARDDTATQGQKQTPNAELRGSFVHHVVRFRDVVEAARRARY